MKNYLEPEEYDPTKEELEDDNVIDFPEEYTEDFDEDEEDEDDIDEDLY